MTDSEYKNKLQKDLIHFLVKDVFNAYTADDVISCDKDGVWYHKGKKLDEESKQRLQENAKNFSESFLWQILKSELIYQASERMYVKSQTPEDMIAGKLTLYIVDVIQKKLDLMSR